MTDADSAAARMTDTDVGAPEARPRGFIVGGCACRDRVAAVVHSALAASDTTSFLDGVGDGDGDGAAARRMSTDHRAGATAVFRRTTRTRRTCGARGTSGRSRTRASSRSGRCMYK
jgi:hypothetical protein